MNSDTSVDMRFDDEQQTGSPNSSWRIGVVGRAFLLACAGASISLGGASAINMYLALAPRLAPGEITSLVLGLALSLVFVFGGTVMTTLIPAAIFAVVAERYRIRSAIAYMIAGTAIALMARATLGAVAPGLPAASPLFHWKFAVAGLIGGLIYWRHARRGGGVVAKDSVGDQFLA